MVIALTRHATPTARGFNLTLLIFSFMLVISTYKGVHIQVSVGIWRFEFAVQFTIWNKSHYSSPTKEG